MYSGDANTALQVSLSAAIPLAYVLQSGFSALEVKKVALEIDSFDEKKQLQIDQVTAMCRYHGREPVITRELLDAACRTYFVDEDPSPQGAAFVPAKKSARRRLDIH